MVGRTPEYLGKKLGGREVKFASLYLLTTPAIVLISTAVAMALLGERAGMLNSGAHGLSEVLYEGKRVELARFWEDYGDAEIVAIRGIAPEHPAVPADAVTASGSGLDLDISPAYALLQEALVARTRGMTLAQLDTLVAKYRTGRGLGFLGEPTVNVLKLNLALDRSYPYRP